MMEINKFSYFTTAHGENPVDTPASVSSPSGIFVHLTILVALVVK